MLCLVLVASVMSSPIVYAATPAPAPAAVVTALGGRALAGVATLEAGAWVKVNEFAPEVTLDAPPGGLGPFVDSGSITGQFDSLTGFEAVSTQGGGLGTQAGSVTSTATITGLSIAGYRQAGVDDVIAAGIDASCTANGDGAGGTVSVTGASIFGVPVPAGAVAPNTGFTKLVQTDIGFLFVSVALNEQTVTNDAGATGMAMNALRINLAPNIGPRRTLVLGQLRCQATTTPAPRPLVGDFTGDGQTDIAVWRPDNGTWYVRGISETVWGQSGDVPEPADYDGDGKADFAVWRPSNGTWYIRGVSETVWGQLGDIPVPADYDGDGKADLAVYRPSNGTWYVRGISETVWGQPGDVPVAADYAGDSAADLAVWRPANGTWYVRGFSETVWGEPGDIPVPANYGGDAKVDLAVWRPANGTWYLRGIAEKVWGQLGDIPVSGDYNGDGTDIAVWRPVNATWYVHGISETVWGAITDLPV